MNTLLTAAVAHGPTVLAVDPAKVKPGWLALVILSLIGVATYLLWRSMNRQLKKVDFDDGIDRSKGGPGRMQRTQHGAARDESGPAPASDEGPVADGNGGAASP